MSKQQYPPFTLYEAESAIPGYQRAGVWGLAALAILLCGLIAGGLLGAARILPLAGKSTLPNTALLTRQDAINQHLRERITGLEQALGGDVCTPAARQALLPDRR